MTTVQMLTVKQVAERLQTSYDGVLNLIAAGELPAHNISGGHGTGARYRIDQRDLDRWLESRKTAAP